jgi:hypothetical protein
MSRKVFTAGEVLAAADVNSFLMDQSVMSFAGTAARGSAIPSPVEGMVSYLEDSNLLSIYDGSNWKNSVGATGGILKVVQTVKTDTFSTSSTSFTGVTGLSATITPSSTSSKILVIAQITYGLASSLGYGHFRLSGGNSGTYIGDSAGSRIRAVFGGFSNANVDTIMPSDSIVYLDSPATTSATTYGVEVRQSFNGSVFINRQPTAGDSDGTFTARGASSITLMEVSA